MNNTHIFSQFKKLTENSLSKKQNSQDLSHNPNCHFELEKIEYCRVVALSEVLDISYDKLLNILISNALADAHEGFLSAFCNDDERNNYNQQLKQRVKDLLLVI